MNRRNLNKLNKGVLAEDVHKNILAAGFKKLEEGDFNGISLMTIFKGRERHSRKSKKQDGVYTILQSFCGAEGAENFDFIACSAEKKLKRRNADGKKREYLYCLMFYKDMNEK